MSPRHRRSLCANTMIASLCACVSTVSGSHRDADATVASDVVDASVVIKDIPPTDDVFDVTAVDVAPRPRDAAPDLAAPPCAGEDCLRAVDLRLAGDTGLIRLADQSHRVWGINQDGPFGWYSSPDDPRVPVLTRPRLPETLQRIRLNGGGGSGVDIGGRVFVWSRLFTRPGAQQPELETLPISNAIDALALGQSVLTADRRLIDFERDPTGTWTGAPPDPLMDVEVLPDFSLGVLCVGARSGIWCRGDDSHGALGNDTYLVSSSRFVRAYIPGGELVGVRQVISNTFGVCALLRRNLQVPWEVWCWGAVVPQLVDGFPPDTLFHPLPVHVEVADNARSIDMGGFCFVTAEGLVRCRGDNSWGQLGLGTNAPVSGWTTVPGLRDVVQISGGAFARCARTERGEVWCWGDGRSALLAPLGAPSQRIVPPTRLTWR